jgi:pimeloyl-ACP methyl ester carboxylesterase
MSGWVFVRLIWDTNWQSAIEHRRIKGLGNLSFLRKFTGLAIVTASAFAPRFMARILVPRILTPRRSRSHLSQTHERVDIGNGIVGWQEFGQDPKMPLALFAHGFDGNHDQWNAIGKVVQQAGYRVVFLDPPGHGASKAGQCDPIVFSEAVGAAFKILGPISLYLGHSMGAAAGVMATSETIGADAYVLIAGPVVMDQTIDATARKVGLGRAATDALQNEIGKKVGVHPRNLDLAPSLDDRTAPALIIHDRGDRQVPFSEAETLSASWPDAQLFATDGLGHNQILQDEKVLREVARFLESL